MLARMLPYSRGLILENTHNYGIVKTESVFGFAPTSSTDQGFNNISEPLEWILTNGSFQTSVREVNTTEDPGVNGKSLKRREQKSLKSKVNKKSLKQSKKGKKKRKVKGKSNDRESKKVNKCIIKFNKEGGQGDQESYSGKKRRKAGSKLKQMQKKYMMPVILGLLAAKSILIPIALKALAFMSAKGMMMAFFAAVLASVVSLKGMFHHSHPDHYNRKDDSKTQVEIIQVPTKSEDHVYYDDHYRRGDLIPVLAPDHIMVPNDYVLTPNDNQVINKKGILKPKHFNSKKTKR